MGDAIKLDATCGTVSVSKGSTASGANGKVTFEVGVAEAAGLSAHLDKESFRLHFVDDDLGDGYTISGLRIRPDADGGARAFVTFVAPETVTPAMALLIAHGKVGRGGKLTLDRSQTTLDDQLTMKAE